MRRLRASRSVMSPWLVDRTATPRPPSTRGISSAFVYTRRPGLETRLSREIVRSRSGEYLSVIVSVLPGLRRAVSDVKPVM